MEEILGLACKGTKADSRAGQKSDQDLGVDNGSERALSEQQEEQNGMLSDGSEEVMDYYEEDDTNLGDDVDEDDDEESSQNFAHFSRSMKGWNPPHGSLKILAVTFQLELFLV